VEKKRRVWKGVMIGAAVGAAFSLLIKKEEKQDRLSFPTKLKQWRQSVEEVAEDIEFIVEKIKDIVEKTPEVIEIVKEAYSWKKDDRPRIK
jgi:gas vesicle protein